MDYYILKDRKPIKATQMEWAEQLRDNGECKRIGLTNYKGVSVSTVFLGIDHSFGRGVPILYETMVFGLEDADEVQIRYSTIEEAEAGHLQIVMDYLLKDFSFLRH